MPFNNFVSFVFFVGPPLLVVILFVTNNKQVMGEHTNGSWANVLGGLATLAMFAAAGGLVLTWLLI